MQRVRTLALLVWVSACAKVSALVFLLDGAVVELAEVNVHLQAEGHKVSINVFGRTDYSAGQRVHLSVPRSTQIKKNDDPEDKILSGNYLIGAICHLITLDSHQCTMELIKDSYMTNINDAK